jgi:hypothetical protein
MFRNSGVYENDPTVVVDRANRSRCRCSSRNVALSLQITTPICLPSQTISGSERAWPEDLPPKNGIQIKCKGYLSHRKRCTNMERRGTENASRSLHGTKIVRKGFSTVAKPTRYRQPTPYVTMGNPTMTITTTHIPDFSLSRTESSPIP